LPAIGQEITVSGTGFLLDAKPFPYTGYSFFNALYNPAFNTSDAARKEWLEKFRRYGINVVRIWGQWDNKRGFVDTCPNCSLYTSDGALRPEILQRLKALAAEAGRAGMVVELALFSQESWHDGVRLAPETADRAVTSLTREMLSYRNITFQVWNEFSERVMDHIKSIRSIDARRLLTNSPGFAGVLGDSAQNVAVDYLTPHTTRQGVRRHWEIAPAEIRYLLARWRRPVVDDEPARNGTSQFGGPREQTYPYDHIVQILRVWEVGGYVTYHHDMFQMGASAASVPPSGIPDPEFNPYHRQVLEFLALRDRYSA
jgi:hypothetical protein